jgi:hypothetical protein
MQEQSKINWSSLTFYTETEIFLGLIKYPVEQRLSDFLNRGCVEERDAKKAFLEVIDSSFIDADSKNDTQIRKYVNKTSVQLIGLSDSNVGRGIGAREGAKVYPYVEKLPVRVGLRLPTYIITGNMHYSNGQGLQDVLSQNSIFLPLTSAAITFLQDGVTSIKPFAVVNREQILFSQEVEN